MTNNEKKDLHRIMLDIQATRWYYKIYENEEQEQEKHFVNDDYFYKEAIEMIQNLLK